MERARPYILRLLIGSVPHIVEHYGDCKLVPQFPAYRQALHVEPVRRLVIAQMLRLTRQVGHWSNHLLYVAQLPVYLQALFIEHTRICVISQIPNEDSQAVESLAYTTLVAQLAEDSQSLF